MPFTLITAATTSSAHKIKSTLANQPVILGDYRDMPDFMLKPGKMIRLPNPASASYAHEMLTLCLDLDIDTVYPIDGQEHALLAEAAQLFTEFNITIINPNEV